MERDRTIFWLHIDHGEKNALEDDIKMDVRELGCYVKINFRKVDYEM
jgi:hypothetical protein